jgi:tetratricopeptide (TPR) repeat protein/predicted Ser/Thr protein kinase
MIGDQILHYRVVRQLGSGGMGVVYEAEDTRLGRHVAMKFLPPSLHVSPEAIDRFEREARIASSLNHPNICTIYDVGVHDGRQFIVMELLEGDSLRGRIAGHPLPLEQILDTSCQIADALDAAHAKGIIHRDLKPANIFITKRGQAKLVDFGIAKLSSDRQEHDATAETKVAGDILTVPGMAVGSINYMSPEQARGEELDGRTDLFSLGVVLYEMCTGRQAFAGQTTAVVFDAILNRQPAEPRMLRPELPEELQRVILRSLEKDRRLRFQTAADMLAELSRIRRDTTAGTLGAFTGATAVNVGTAPVERTAVTPAQTTTAAQPAAARSRTGLLVVAALLLVGLAVGGYFIWKGSKPPALTAKDTLLVADFANSTGDAVFDDALRQAVSVQLQQSPFVTLLPDQRVQRTLRLMQRQPEERVVGPVAREVCQRAGARASVEGSIAALGTSYVLTLGVHNCQTGESLAEQQVQASSKEDVIKQLGVAVTQLRSHLGESLASIQKYDVPVTEATTTSLEALRAYGQAVRARTTKGDAASVPFFKEALSRDPNFALAYAKLGVVTSNIGQVDEARALAEKAYSLRDHVSEYERMYINWNYAARVLQDPKATKDALELLTTAYPRDFAGRNNLGIYYNGQGQFEEALREYKVAIEIAPDEPTPIMNAAYASLFLGKRDEAYAFVEKLQSIRPDPGLAMTMWFSALVDHDPRAKDLEAIAHKLASEDQWLGAQGTIALWHGRFKDYVKTNDELKNRARATRNEQALQNLETSEEVVQATYLGGPHLERLKAHAAKETNPVVLAQLTAALAANGELTIVRATLPRLLKEGRSNQAVWLPTTVAQAYVLLTDGRKNEALTLVRQALNDVPRAFDFNYFIGYIQGSNGDIDGAIASYRTILKMKAFLGPTPVVPMTHLALGALLEKKGDPAGAKALYDELLERWKDADTDFPLLRQAKEVRARTKS